MNTTEQKAGRGRLQWKQRHEIDLTRPRIKLETFLVSKENKVSFSRSLLRYH